MEPNNFKKSDRVHHPIFGLGTVTDIREEGRIEITFDAWGDKILALKYVDLRKITTEEEQKLNNQDASFEDFWGDPADDEELHVHGNHWDVFKDDVEAFLEESLPRALRLSQLASGWADNHKPLYDLSEKTFENVLLCYPGGRQGIKSILQINRKKEHHEVMTFFPFVSEGAQHTLKLLKIYPWQDDVEAQIEASVMNIMNITFFDTEYVLNKGFYGPELSYQFVLAGFAYTCRIDEAEPIAMTKEMRNTFEIFKKDDPDFEIPEQLEMKGMAAFLPTDGGDRDDFQFRGPVKKIDELNMLDENFFRIRTTVARFTIGGEDEDFDLDIYVNSKRFGDTPPVVGDDIAGVMWLQGYMLYPGIHTPITKD